MCDQEKVLRKMDKLKSLKKKAGDIDWDKYIVKPQQVSGVLRLKMALRKLGKTVPLVLVLALPLSAKAGERHGLPKKSLGQLEAMQSPDMPSVVETHCEILEFEREYLEGEMGTDISKEAAEFFGQRTATPEQIQLWRGWRVYRCRRDALEGVSDE